MTTEELKSLPREEKVLMMETLWVDLRDHFEQAVIPATHKTLLDTRREQVVAGESRLLDWDQVKSTIGRP